MRKVLKRFFAAAIVAVMIVCAAPLSGFVIKASADGYHLFDSVPNGYQAIYTIRDLMNIKDGFSNKYILMKNLDMRGVDWIPKVMWNGEFEGNGYVIKNLHISKNRIYYYNLGLLNVNGCGLFCNSSGSIKNLTLDNITIIAPSDAKHIGGIVGEAMSGCVIENCHVSGVIYNTSTVEKSCVGGMVGYSHMDYKGSSSFLYDSSNITIFGNSKCYAGGLVGNNDYRGYSSGTQSISDCYSICTILNAGNAGGLFGYYNAILNYDNGYFSAPVYSRLENCYSKHFFKNCNNIGTVSPIMITDNSKIQNLYFNSNIDANKYSNTYGVSLDSLINKNDFIGFDFENVWELTNGKYPTLRQNIIESQNRIYSLNRISNGNDIVISPRSVNAPGDSGGLYDKLFPLDNVTMTTNNQTRTNSALVPDFTYISENQTSEIKLTHADFQDYIIPQQVVSSWKSANIENTNKTTSPDYKHTAVMQKNNKDGKPYISTVFIRNKNMDTYQEAITQPMEITQGKNCDVIISSVGKGTYKYYLAQDANHKVESTTGIFTDIDLYSEFDFGKKVFAYMADGNGVYIDFVELNLTKARDSLASPGNFLSNSTFDILGSDFAKITIPSDVPLFGKAEISLNAFKFPAGFTYDGESMKISIGANIFNAKHEYDYNSKEYKKWEYGCFKDWKGTVKEEVKKETEGRQKAKKSYKKAKESFSEKWKNTASVSKDNNWDIDALGYIDMALVNGQWVVKEASISLEGSFTFNYTWQGAIWIIPAYAYVEASASLGGTATGSRYIADSSIPFEWEFSVKLEPELKLGAGIGVKKAASLGLWAKATLPIEINITRQNLNIAVSGSIGWEGQLAILKASGTIFEGEQTLVDKYYGSNGKNKIVTRKNPISGEDEQYFVTYSIADRAYLAAMSGWLGGSSGRLRAKSAGSADSFHMTDLQTSVYSNAQPRVTTFGDKLLMTWVTDDTSRDEYNRMKLMYSVYDGSVWSEPQTVYDDGKNDNAPVIVSDGINVYFVWQKIAKKLTEDDLTDETAIIESTELYIAKYDSASGTIVNVQRVTNNNCYDYAHDISIINGSPVLYFASCTDNDMLSGSANTISRYAFSGSASTVKSGLNYILSLDSGYINGAETLAYSTDGDGDTSTTDDITVYTYSAGTTAELVNGLNKNPVTEVIYGEFSGKYTLFTTDMSNIYYQQDGETKTVFEQNQQISSNLSYVEDEQKPAFIWTQSTENTNEVYAVYFEDGEWTSPVQVGETETKLAGISAVSYANRIIGTCTSSILTYDGEREMNVPSQTNLSYFTIGDKDDLSVDSIKIDECNIVKGEATEFNVFVTNNGTRNVISADFTVTDTLGTQQVFTQSIDLAPGETKMATLSYTAPSDYTTSTLSVAVSSDEITDVNTENNTTSETIGRPNIVLTESEVHEVDGHYLVTAFVTNESEVDAQNVMVNVFLGEETNLDSTITIDSLVARETKVIEIVFDGETISFDENDTCKVYFSAEIENCDMQKGNKISYILSKNNDVCAHIFTEYLGQIEPTCMLEGYHAGTKCLGCGKYVSGGDVIPATGHSSVVNVAGVEPTCVETGLTEGTHCSVCGVVLTEQEEISALGHNFSTSSITTAPDCTHTGIRTYYCSRCDATRTETVSANGHTWNIGTVIKEPTCFEVGTRKYICTVCGAEEERNISKLVHNYVDGVCTRCGTEIPSIRAGETKTVSVTGSSVSYLKFVPGVTGNYSFTSNSSIDTYGYLYDSDFNQITYNDDGGSGSNFLISYDLIKGTTYYFGCRYYSTSTSGSFDVTLTLNSVLETLTPTENTTTVIDSLNGYIYGINPRMDNPLDYFSVNSGYDCDMNGSSTLPDGNPCYGTGSMFTIKSGDTVVAKYSLVIFGDVNGDGWYDGQDAVTVSMIAGGMLTREQVGEAVWMAADCNQDGVIDQADVDLLNQAGVLLSNVDQTKSSDELLETSSEYIEYLNLIDQQTDADSDEATENNTDDNEETTEFSLWNIIVKYFVELIKKFLYVIKVL